jgi:hypothetical protein
MAQKLKQGYLVTVFQKPISEEQPEGTAMLLVQTNSYHLTEENTFERWFVRFISDGYECERSILGSKN